MAYYAEEAPLPADFDELFVVTSAVKTIDKDAVRKVADRFFPVGDDGHRHNARADAEIEKAQRRIQTARQNGAKGGRKAQPDANPAGNPAGNPTGTQRDTQPGTQWPTHSGEALHTPHATSQVGDYPASTEGLERASAAGRACLAMRKAGCVQVNPSHPDLLAALAEGVTADELADAVREGLSRSPPVTKPFAWAITTTRSRRAAGPRPIATTTGASPHETRAPSRRLSAVEQVQQAIHERRARDGDGQPPAAA